MACQQFSSSGCIEGPFCIAVLFIVFGKAALQCKIRGAEKLPTAYAQGAEKVFCIS
jgi:hypothetical protein